MDAQGWPGTRPGPGHTQAGLPREAQQGEARERPGGGKYFWGLGGGPIAKEGGGGKGPNSDPGVSSVPKAKRRASRRRGGASSFPEEEELRREGPVVTGCAGRVDRL